MTKTSRFSSNIHIACLGLLVGSSAAALQGCKDGGVLDSCGLTCNGNAFVEGNATISGIASVDAFFGAALDLKAALGSVSADIRGNLDKIAASLNLEAGATGAQIKGALEAKFSATLQGGINIEYAPPRCEASVEVTASAAAQCDATVDPGSVEVSCEGSCEVEAGVMVDCGAEAELKCTGTAPNLACEGECQGNCAADFSAGGACEGTCKGTCSGNCSLTNAMGECEGQCDATCTGTCDIELKAGATCDGKCEGQCTYTPPMGMCEASASAKCEAMAGGSVECSAKCEGSATPPSVSAECEASVQAKASASVQCNPPELLITYEFAAGVDANAQAEFRAWLEGFKVNFAAILGARAKASLVVDAANGLVDAAGNAVADVFTELAGDANLKVAVGAACAIDQLPTAASAISSAIGELSANVSASAEVVAAVGG